MSTSPRPLPRNIRRASLFFKLFNFEHLAHIPLGILLFFAFVTLTIMVSFPALISVERNETMLTRLLADKGFSLITAFENVLRTGMRSQVGIRLQFLLEQMVQSGDITFIACRTAPSWPSPIASAWAKSSISTAGRPRKPPCTSFLLVAKSAGVSWR